MGMGAAWMEQIVNAYLNPGEGDADRNGHTRLSVLMERFHLSCLKVQKILVTAGVYEPVKDTTAFEQVSALFRQGKRIAEIAEETGLSQAAVCAYVPYSREAYAPEKLGGEANGDAKRKRRQREKEALVRGKAAAALRRGIREDVFWETLRQHGRDVFRCEDGERYRAIAMARMDARENMEELIEIRRLGDRNPGREEGVAAEISRETAEKYFYEVLDAQEDGRPEKRSERPALKGGSPAQRYLRPILLSFGVIPGKMGKAGTRRNPDPVCTCCGREEDRLFRVRTFADLEKTGEQIRKEREEKQAERDAVANRPGDVFPQEKIRKEWKARQEEKLEDARHSRTVQRFDGEKEERYLCEYCAETIRMALEEGDIPLPAGRTAWELLSPEELETRFLQSVAKPVPGEVWEDMYQIRYDPETLAREKMYLFRIADDLGVKHTFVLSRHMIWYEATEVHRLTGKGKRAGRDSGTDYHVRYGFELSELSGEREGMEPLGYLRLEDRIREQLENHTLQRNESPFAGVEFGDTLRETGTVQIIAEGIVSAVGDGKTETEENGFLIDGKWVTPEKFRKMLSPYEGWQIRYQIADPCERPLRSGEYLLPVALNVEGLEEETAELLNLFCKNGAFLSEHDHRNFDFLFDRVLEKLKQYHDNNPRGFGKLAGMRMIRKLKWVEGTQNAVEKVRIIIM